MPRPYEPLFVRVAAEQGRVVPAKVQEAFRAQQRDRSAPPIELIFVERGTLTHAQVAEILSVHARRFAPLDPCHADRVQLWEHAALAVRAGWAPESDVNVALREHARREEARAPWAALGQILADLGLLKPLGGKKTGTRTPPAGTAGSDPTVLVPTDNDPTIKAPIPAGPPTGLLPLPPDATPRQGPRRPTFVPAPGSGSDPTVLTPVVNEKTRRNPVVGHPGAMPASPGSADRRAGEDSTIRAPLPPGVAPPRPGSDPVLPAARKRPLLDENQAAEPLFPAGPRLTRTQSKLVGRWIGPYLVESEVGRGGMSVVYGAIHSKTREKVALKVLMHGDQAAARSAQRFRQEAAAASKLDHPGIVRVLDIGEQGDYSYIAMEFIEGVTLDRVIHDPEHLHLELEHGAPETRKGLSARVALAMVKEIAEAIQYAHDQGVIHRDLKPSNVLRHTSGRLKVMDFGLAKVVDAGKGPLTGSGAVLGTAPYMSPEQADGQSAMVDHRTDVYQLGAILYEMLCGHPPYEGGGSVEIILRILGGEVPTAPREWDPSVDEQAETICRTAMAHEPERRYPTAAALAEACARWLEGKPPGRPRR